MARPWIVLKFGGTSVARAESWARIAQRVGDLLPTHRVWICASALSQVSNQLERAVAHAVAGEPPGEALAWIRSAHRRLADDVGLTETGFAPVEELLDQLGRLLEGIALTREASPRLRARVMSFGELASTHLGIAALAHHGVDGIRVDARELLTSTESPQQPQADRYLEAMVRPRSAPAQVDALVGEAGVVLTQGFIARTPRGETCLLGRGGSDTSGALFAALLKAAELEIWTDVHGLFTTDPRRLPTARLIRRIHYRGAQELAAMGAKVLHPRCLEPAAWARIPVRVRHSGQPDFDGTLITADVSHDPAVLAVVQRRGVTLLSVETLAMWGTSGFLAQVFAPFERLGVSVDLVATSQSAVSVTLDRLPGGLDGEVYQKLLAELSRLGEVQVVTGCAVVSIVGHQIRTVLHQLGPALAAFEEHRVHLVSQSSEDLNLSFVVDEADAGRLVASLHDRLLPRQGGEGLFGPTWEQLERRAAEQAGQPTGDWTADRWWRAERAQLTQIGSQGSAFVYHLPTVRARARALRTQVTAVGRFYYAMKANGHPEVVRAIADEGLGLECVSAAEVRFVRELLGEEVPILFTPNFCGLAEYQQAFQAGAEVTIDGPRILAQAPELFRGRAIALRIDPGGGQGHHEKVRTAGQQAKFGHPIADLPALLAAVNAVDATVTGLHAHVGSGILSASSWSRTLELLSGLRAQLPSLRWIDIGGGLGVVERPGQSPLDLDALQRSISGLASQLHGVQLRMEPGRYLVSEGGVLVSPVTQVRQKGAVRFCGLETGMNSLIRPALYGAWHGIHNLSQLDQPAEDYWMVVGPICETGDVLGRDRLLPPTRPGDVVLIDNAGAYGRVMSSSYNMRPPAREVVLP